MTLQECIKDRIHKIEKEEEQYKKIKTMCIEIEEADYQFHTIDISTYFEKMNVINKEGFTMRNIKTSRTQKIVGAIISSIAFSFFFIFLVGTISYFQFTESDKMPWIIFWILIFVFCIPIFGIGGNLVKRIKEINGGEEDEASKY